MIKYPRGTELEKLRHSFLRVPLITVEEHGDGRGVFAASGWDLAQLSAGRKPCGKMGVNADYPGLLFFTAANLDLMGNQGVRCSWQSGNSNPPHFNLTELQLNVQAVLYCAPLVIRALKQG